jgi:23S rRNA pseudouridine2605 synthase
MKMRLQKALAEAGFASRRGSEELIKAGRVTVDGVTAELGASADADTQVIAVDGRPIAPEAKEYWLLNKPAGVLSAVTDARGRPTVVDCVPTRARVFPVGRLDLDSTGLLLLTNDGDLTGRLLHPRFHVEKEYEVLVRGLMTRGALETLRSGVLLEDGLTAPALIHVLEVVRPPRTGPQTSLRIVLHEGRKRQVRRMLEAVGHRVVALHRTRFDGLTVTGLAPGQARRLSAAELARLRQEPGSVRLSKGVRGARSRGEADR